MIKYLSFFICAMVCLSVEAGTINSTGTYKGKINGVAIGFWGHVGVGLDGVACNEKNEVLLLTSNGKYKEILSVLLAAEASKSIVNFYRLNVTLQEVAPNYTYCVITSASLGSFPVWQ